ncbi:hypothetical protein MUN81_22235 (plasmid) [Hymenobacter sp. 5317J-9]|uniref:hypothetical protein n=1 Tax=Hymenobacter sp. 5317J-9 TaxID=2932250 RepID=UPI001FD65E53|nr:hypothetical protein [Hymenobacter sp. 5317J-9]UOR00188.1 hypothetical protein MUN81_22235 [Hymenobacter sp. 5317J-9]
MITIKSSGLGRLNELAQNIEQLSQRSEVSSEELFNAEFIAQHTQSTSFTEFVRAGGFVFDSAEDFKAIPDAAFDEHVRHNTDFPNWHEMQLAAARTWARQQLLK